MRFELVGIIVITSQDTGRSHHITVGIHNRQDIAGLAPLTSLIGDRFPAFLRQGVRTVQIEFRQIQLCSQGQNAVLPDGFEAAVMTPLEKMVVYRSVTDFFFSEPGLVAIANCSH